MYMGIFRRSSRTAFGAAVLALSASALLMLSGCESGGKGGRTKTVNTDVEVMTIQPQDVEYSRMITGRTEAVLLAEVRPQVSGILKKRLFDEGADVKEGDVLYLIDDALYKASFKSAEAALHKVQANNEVLRVKLARFKSMLARKAVSQQDYDDLEALYKSSSAEVRVQKALVDEARIQYEYTRIKAPISGRIGLSRVTPGALVTQHQGEALAVIHQLDPIHVKLTMSASELSTLRRKMAQGIVEPGSFGKVRLFFDDGTPYDHEGVIDFSDAAVTADTGSVTLRATFENPDHLLMPNMAVRAELIEGRASRALLVPQPAVSLNADGSASLFILGEGNVAQLRTVTLAGSKGRAWQIIDGIKPGETIITNGLRYVKPGMKVTISREGN